MYLFVHEMQIDVFDLFIDMYFISMIYVFSFTRVCF